MGFGVEQTSVENNLITSMYLLCRSDLQFKCADEYKWGIESHKFQMTFLVLEFILLYLNEKYNPVYPNRKQWVPCFFKKDAFPEFTVFAVAWVWNKQTYTNTNFQYCLMVFWVVNITYIAISICCLILIDNWLWSKTQKWYLKIL